MLHGGLIGCEQHSVESQLNTSKQVVEFPSRAQCNTLWHKEPFLNRSEILFLSLNVTKWDVQLVRLVRLKLCSEFGCGLKISLTKGQSNILYL